METPDKPGPRKRSRWPRIVGVVAALAVLLGLVGDVVVLHADTLHLRIRQNSTPTTIFDFTTSDASVVQPLYAHLLTLPTAPSGTIACPTGPPVTYDLTLSHFGLTLVAATDNAAICGFFTPVFGSARIPDDEFWTLLSRAVHKPLPILNPCSGPCTVERGR